MSINDKIRSFFNIADDTEINDIFENIKSNLSNGNFKFVVLMDKLTDRLRDLLSYLNINCNFDFYAVELDYYKFDSYEIIIPKLYGNETRKKSVSSTSAAARKKWDEKSFLEDINNKNDENIVIKLNELYAFAKEISDEIIFGTGIENASATPMININNKKVRLFYLYSNGRLQLP